MATWIVHLRVAQRLAERFAPLACIEFAVGSLAADCGAVMPDGSYSPPSSVTHWLKAGQGKQSCDYSRFAERYLNAGHTPAENAFLLGYYAHLVTDMLWSEKINLPLKQKYSDFYKSDRDGFYRAVKPDWYECDFRYLCANPDFEPYRELCALERLEIAPERLLGYYRDGMIMRQMENICEYYQGRLPEERELKYLTEAQVNRFVELAADDIAAMLKQWTEA